MKTRNGFVSNSSSSSYVVLFDKKPETIEEVIETLQLRGNIREDIVKSIFDKAQICEGHIKTYDELASAIIRRGFDEGDWSSDREEYPLEIFGRPIIVKIQEKIDSYFHYPDHPYKVTIDMGDQHYGLDIAEECDKSRFIPFASIDKIYAIESYDNQVPRNTVEQEYQELLNLNRSLDTIDSMNAPDAVKDLAESIVCRLSDQPDIKWDGDVVKMTYINPQRTMVFEEDGSNINMKIFRDGAEEETVSNITVEQIPEQVDFFLRGC